MTTERQRILPPSSSVQHADALDDLTSAGKRGSFLFGFDTGVISGALVKLNDDIALSDVQAELVVSLAVAGAFVGSIIGGVLNDVIGRKPCVIVSSALFVSGSVVMGAADGLTMLLIGRVLVGLGIGVASMVVPMYVAEAAPSERRGALVSVTVLFITTGQLVSYVIDAAFATVHEGWRFMLGLGAAPALVQLVAMFFLPESPRFLLLRGQRARAVAVLQSLRGAADVGAVEAELSEMLTEVVASGDRLSARAKCAALLTQRAGLRALMIGLGLQALQQLSGINTVMYYSSSILRMSGFPSNMAIFLSVPVAATNALMTLVAVFCVDRCGRRRLLLVTLPGVVVSLVVLGVAFLLYSQHAPPIDVAVGPCVGATTCVSCIAHAGCGFCVAPSNVTSAAAPLTLCLPGNATGPLPNVTLACAVDTWSTDVCPNAYGWLAMLALITYLVSFAPGMGPVPWTVNSEIHALQSRGIASGMASAVNWLFNLIVSLTFLSLITAIGAAWTFGVFAFLAGASWLFVFVFVPETGGRLAHEIQHELREGPLCVPCARGGCCGRARLAADDESAGAGAGAGGASAAATAGGPGTRRYSTDSSLFGSSSALLQSDGQSARLPGGMRSVRRSLDFSDDPSVSGAIGAAGGGATDLYPSSSNVSDADDADAVADASGARRPRRASGSGPLPRPTRRSQASRDAERADAGAGAGAVAPLPPHPRTHSRGRPPPAQ